MEMRRLSRGDWVAAVSAVVLFVALFLPWYSAGGADANAWETMAVNDVLIALAAAAGLAAVVTVALARFPGFSVASVTLAALPALVALALVVVRVVSPAPEADVSLELGAWLGLVSAIGLVAGLWAAARDEGPARRDPETERAAAQEALARAELLSLPPDVGTTTPNT